MSWAACGGRAKLQAVQKDEVLAKTLDSGLEVLWQYELTRNTALVS